MKEFTAPEMEVVEFTTVDVITASNVSADEDGTEIL